MELMLWSKYHNCYAVHRSITLLRRGSLFSGGGLRTSEGNEHMGGTGKRNVTARGGTPLNDMTFGVHRRTVVG